MEYVITFRDANGSWAVIVNDFEKPGLIGHHYRFKPMKAEIVKDAYDEADFHYFRKSKTPIPAGTEVMIDDWWMNFYGAYFTIEWEGSKYDVKTDCVAIKKEMETLTDSM